MDRCESDAPRVFVAGNVKFDNTTFRGEVCISNVTFEGEVTFRFAKFEKRLFFESVDFAEEVNFYDADVAGKVRFIRVNFDKVVTFDKAPFRGEMRFGRETEMSGVTFKGDATFNKTRFGSKTEMFGVTFEGDAIFDKAQFGGVTEMSDVEFVESSAFTSVTFKGPTGLLNSRFSTNRSATTTFAKAKFEANSSFEGSTFFGWRTSFADATFERSVHPPARAEGQLDLKWGQVHRTVPTLGRAETMNGWENFFTTAGLASEVRKVRKEALRDELKPWRMRLAFVWAGMVLLFCGLYAAFWYLPEKLRRAPQQGQLFRLDSMRPNWRRAFDLLLYSVELSTHSINFVGRDWSRTFSIERASYLRAIHGVLAWGFVTVVAIFIAAWITA